MEILTYRYLVSEWLCLKSYSQRLSTYIRYLCCNFAKTRSSQHVLKVSRLKNNSIVVVFPCTYQNECHVLFPSRDYRQYPAFSYVVFFVFAHGLFFKSSSCTLIINRCTEWRFKKFDQKDPWGGLFFHSQKKLSLFKRERKKRAFMLVWRCYCYASTAFSSLFNL